MKFNFPTVETRELPMGHNVRGMCIRGERPVSITLDHRDLEDLIFSMRNNVEMAGKYLIDLKNCLGLAR